METPASPPEPRPTSGPWPTDTLVAAGVLAGCVASQLRGRHLAMATALGVMAWRALQRPQPAVSEAGQSGQPAPAAPQSNASLPTAEPILSQAGFVGVAASVSASSLPHFLVGSPASEPVAEASPPVPVPVAAALPVLGLEPQPSPEPRVGLVPGPQVWPSPEPVPSQAAEPLPEVIESAAPAPVAAPAPAALPVAETPVHWAERYLQAAPSAFETELSAFNAEPSAEALSPAAWLLGLEPLPHVDEPSAELTEPAEPSASLSAEPVAQPITESASAFITHNPSADWTPPATARPAEASIIPDEIVLAQPAEEEAQLAEPAQAAEPAAPAELIASEETPASEVDAPAAATVAEPEPEPEPELATPAPVVAELVHLAGLADAVDQGELDRLTQSHSPQMPQAVAAQLESALPLAASAARPATAPFSLGGLFGKPLASAASAAPQPSPPPAPAVEASLADAPVGDSPLSAELAEPPVIVSSATEDQPTPSLPEATSQSAELLQGYTPLANLKIIAPSSGASEALPAAHAQPVPSLPALPAPPVQTLPAPIFADASADAQPATAEPIAPLAGQPDSLPSPSLPPSLQPGAGPAASTVVTAVAPAATEATPRSSVLTALGVRSVPSAADQLASAMDTPLPAKGKTTLPPPRAAHTPPKSSVPPGPIAAIAPSQKTPSLALPNFQPRERKPEPLTPQASEAAPAVAPEPQLPSPAPRVVPLAPVTTPLEASPGSRKSSAWLNFWK